MARKPGSKSSITIASPSGKSGSHGGPITSESIASDLAAFRAGGGSIEVLGTTRVLTPSEEAQAAKTLKKSA
jgi:hypothetical protein